MVRLCTDAEVLSYLSASRAIGAIACGDVVSCADIQLAEGQRVIRAYLAKWRVGLEFSVD